MTDGQRRTVESYIAALDEDRRAPAEVLSSAVRSAEPESTESMKWRQHVYSCEGPFVALKAFCAGSLSPSGMR